MGTTAMTTSACRHVVSVAIIKQRSEGCCDDAVTRLVRVDVRADRRGRAHVGQLADDRHIQRYQKRTVRGWKRHHRREVIRQVRTRNVRDGNAERAISRAKYVVI